MRPEHFHSGNASHKFGSTQAEAIVSMRPEHFHSGNGRKRRERAAPASPSFNEAGAFSLR